LGEELESEIKSRKSMRLKFSFYLWSVCDLCLWVDLLWVILGEKGSNMSYAEMGLKTPIYAFEI
jgi:hypothetical protein